MIEFILLTLSFYLSYGQDLKEICNWFGYYIDTPIYPMYVCSTYVNEDEMNGLFKYSTTYECDYEGTPKGSMSILEYNDTDCTGEPYSVTTYTKGIMM